MIDLFLRAGNAGASACPFLQGEDKTGKHWLTSGDGFALDIIGPVVTAPGTYGEDGDELTPPTFDSRFHANLRCTEEVAATVPESFRVEPNSPSRVWA